MRIKLDPQEPLDFSPARLKVTRDYHQKYEAVDLILAETPQILTAFHRDVSRCNPSLSAAFFGGPVFRLRR